MGKVLSRVRRHWPFVGATALLAVALSLGMVDLGRMSSAYAYEQGYHESICATMDERQRALEKVMAQAQDVLGSTTDDDVADAGVLDTLSADLAEGDALVSYEPSCAEGDYWVQRWRSLEGIDAEAVGRLEQVRSLHVTLLRDLAEVESSVYDKKVGDARDALAASIETARNTLSESEGRVADEGTRDALSATIDAAQALVDGDSADLGALQEQQAALEEARDSVTCSVDEYEREQAAREAEARAASVSASTWYVSYYNAYGTAEAAADGSVTQWADGYFIAHVWSSNGQRILSKPACVVVDGRTYRYVSSMEVSRDTKWKSVEPYVHANGGIGFQTCINGGGYFISHYEPVG